MMHALERAVGSARAERIAAAAVRGDHDVAVKCPLTLSVVDMKRSRRPFLVHH